MKLSLVLAALLCFTTWMSMVHATHGPIGNCLCPMLSKTKVRAERIVDYTQQSGGICPVTAIIFRTKTGKSLCSDPNSDWARRIKQKVDEEKKKKNLEAIRQTEDESTSTVTPAASTASKNTPTSTVTPAASTASKNTSTSTVTPAASTASKNTPKRRNRFGRRRQRKKSRRARKALRKRI